MKYRKIAAALLCAALSLSLFAGCGAGSSAAASGQSQPSAAPEAPSPDEAPVSVAPEASEAEEGQAHVIVVYFSATGTTRRVAEGIAQAASADIFELTPAEPYTSGDLNWSDSSSRVSREHEDESLRDVELTTTEVENWDEYDTVFLGYPIWWGIAAWPVDNFVKNNDFTGKTVIPFATSASSGMGQSGELLAELAGTGDWQEGQRFSGGASDGDIADWVSGLGLGG